MFIVFFLALASASFTNCRNKHAFQINALNADPLEIVYSQQRVTFNVSYTVPQNAYIPFATLETVAKVNGFKLPSHKQTFSKHSLTPGTHNYDTSLVFPNGIWGYVIIDVNIYNSSGTQLLCVRWSVFSKAPS